MDTVWLDAMVGYAAVAVELELAEAAEQLLDILGPYHDQVPCEGVTSWEPVSMYLGGLSSVLGHHDEAERYFREADELNTRGGMQFAEAKTNLWWARALLSHLGEGDAERAKELLEQARSKGRELGYPLVEQRAHEAIRRLKS